MYLLPLNEPGNKSYSFFFSFLQSETGCDTHCLHFLPTSEFEHFFIQFYGYSIICGLSSFSLASCQLFQCSPLLVNLCHSSLLETLSHPPFSKYCSNVCQIILHMLTLKFLCSQTGMSVPQCKFPNLFKSLLYSTSENILKCVFVYVYEV